MSIFTYFLLGNLTEYLYLCNTQIYKEMQSRRSFIKNIALAIPAMSMASVMLSSCSKKDELPRKTRKRIGIIGAGISGLHAAMLLHENPQFDIEILEAGDRIGGRIHSMDNAFGMGNVELGASEIYGTNNAWYGIVNRSQTALVASQGPSTYVIGEKIYSQSQIETDSDFIQMDRQLTALKQFQSGSDMSIDQFMTNSNVPERVKCIFEGKTEQFIGTSVDRASAVYNRSEGIEKMSEEKYRSGAKSFSNILLDNYSPVLPFVLNNTAVQSIDYTGNKVKVTDNMQVERVYDQLIITVPLSILKLNPNQAHGISFKPELPSAKREAMDKLGMDAGVRILLKLNKKFWNNGSSSIYTDGTISRFEVIKSDDSKSQYILSASVHGAKAEETLNNKSESEIIRMIKDEWKASMSSDIANSIVESKVVFWGKEAHIQGSFSYHKVGGSTESRAELARPVENRLYFAGEACNTGNNSGTVHGAIDTAESAVKAILKQLA
jgi:monoamine oxidase